MEKYQSKEIREAFKVWGSGIYRHDASVAEHLRIRRGRSGSVADASYRALPPGGPLVGSRQGRPEDQRPDCLVEPLCSGVPLQVLVSVYSFLTTCRSFLQGEHCTDKRTPRLRHSVEERFEGRSAACAA